MLRILSHQNAHWEFKETAQIEYQLLSFKLGIN